MSTSEIVVRTQDTALGRFANFLIEVGGAGQRQSLPS
jgi:hypothetical protein